MKHQTVAALLFAAIFGGILWAAGCEPKNVSQGTVEVNYSSTGGPGSGCAFEADVDGKDATTITYGELYTFPDTFAPGNHTLHMSFMTNTCDGVTCTFSNSAATTLGYGFSASAGDISELNVDGAVNCYTWTVSGS
ncbi:MAG TPA: hypothetical protein VMU88_07385 [bacterium]|nr:hypothetical protein [bacterium]